MREKERERMERKTKRETERRIIAAMKSHCVKGGTALIFVCKISADFFLLLCSPTTFNDVHAFAASVLLKVSTKCRP